MKKTSIVSSLLAALLAATTQFAQAAEIKLLNVSYDPTRELYQEYNTAFATYWKGKTGNDVAVKQSHGGSGKQARAIIDGLEADVATLALSGDIDALAAKAWLIPENWQSRLKHNSSPYTSTIVLLVRKGNPKGIKDWGDLVKPGVQVITPNPKTSGVARWNYLAMWGYALRQELGPDFIAKLKDPAQAEAVAAAQTEAADFVAAIFKNVPVLDSGARGATNTFIQRKLGDVLINWENEILLGANEIDEAGLERVVPPVSILAEPVVAVVEGNAKRKGNEKVARAYLEYLYSDIGQDLAGKYYYRPVNPEFQQKYAHQFPKLELFTINEVFGSWPSANADHFADGASFDRIYQPGQR